MSDVQDPARIQADDSLPSRSARLTRSYQLLAFTSADLRLLPPTAGRRRGLRNRLPRRRGALRGCFIARVVADGVFHVVGGGVDQDRARRTGEGQDCSRQLLHLSPSPDDLLYGSRVTMPQPEGESQRSAPQIILPRPAALSASTRTMSSPNIAPLAGAKPGISDHGMRRS